MLKCDMGLPISQKDERDLPWWSDQRGSSSYTRMIPWAAQKWSFKTLPESNE